MVIKEEILEELLKDCKNPQDLLGKEGLLKGLTKRLLEKPIFCWNILGYKNHGYANHLWKKCW